MRIYWFWNSHTNTTEGHPAATDGEALAHFSQQSGLNLTLTEQDRVAPHMMDFREQEGTDPVLQPRYLTIPVWEVED